MSAPLHAFAIYAQPTGKKGDTRPRWLTTMLMHWTGTSRPESLEGFWKALHALPSVGRNVRVEVHDAPPVAQLPAGKSWDAPDWTDGALRAWDWPDGPAFPLRIAD